MLGHSLSHFARNVARKGLIGVDLAFSFPLFFLPCGPSIVTRCTLWGETNIAKGTQYDYEQLYFNHISTRGICIFPWREFAAPLPSTPSLSSTVARSATRYIE